MKVTIKVRGHEITVARDSDDGDADVEIRKDGRVVVVGMYDAGGLTLSEYSPTGVRVSLRDSLVDSFEERIAEALAEDGDEDDEDEDDEDEDDEPETGGER